jgi:hypothetical protein
MKYTHCLGLAILLPAPAIAAANVDDAIAECARISSTGDRILCLEDALRQLSPATESAVIPEVDDEVLVAEDTESTRSGAGHTATAAGAAVAAAIANQPAAEATSTLATNESQPELGAEQVARQNGVDEEEIRISAAIVEHTLVGTGRLRLTLDNGQIWQQTGDDDDRIARRIRGETDIAVEMWQSRSGGYRMHLLELDRTLRVRRIR